MRPLFSLFFLVALGLFSPKSEGQKAADTASRNIVPNPGFELLGAPPIGWFYKGEHFGQVVKYWKSATTASPDAYPPKIKIPDSWREKGFGGQRPHSGKTMAGFTAFGCSNGKPHCREYVEILLAEPLVVGQSYQVDFWVSGLPRGMAVNNLGAFFSTEELVAKTDEVFEKKPQVVSKNIVSTQGRWAKLSGQFVADEEAEWLTIGNFSTDENTRFEAVNGPTALNFAYYYLDDVLVKKIPPILPIPIKADDLTKLELVEGKTIRLKNIFFEFDKADLLPRSFVELEKLRQILKENPSLVIEIHGHTDSDGEEKYNLELSKKRAKTVVDWLKTEGIASKRLAAKGFGEGQPIVSNDTPENRALNRRVEFLIVKR